MSGSCSCIRIEDLDALRGFIKKLAETEIKVRSVGIQERTIIEKKLDLPIEDRSERVMRLEVDLKTKEREKKLEEYQRFIEKYPHLCEAASTYLQQ